MASQTASDVPVPPGLLLRPFRALRYAADGPALAALTSPPYDVIDDAERNELLAADPHNVVRLILPGAGDAAESGYEAAARQLAQWQADGVLVRDQAPALYVYEESTSGHVQR